MIVLHVLVLWSAFVHTLSSLSYGPSVEFLTRGRNEMRGSTKIRGKTLFLQEYPNKSVLIPLLEGKPSVDFKTAYKYYHDFHFARFFVEAPTGYRIMAVVQSLRLATSAGTQSKCLDHISFHDIQTSNQTSNICGSVRKDDFDYNPETLIGPRYFVSSGDDMAVDIFIISIPKDDKASGNKGGLTIEIAFTAFRPDAECNSTQPQSRNSIISCMPDIDLDPDDAQLHECLPISLFCNGVINCASSNSVAFAYDEQNCTEIKETEGASFDIDESNIMEEIRYRRKLAEIEDTNDTWIIHYAVIGLAGVVISILVFSCLCYWGIWLFPSDDKKSDKQPEESEPDITLAHDDILESNTSTVVETKLGLGEKKLRSNSLAPLRIPATLHVNPDGSHSIEAYHGNRRLTISVT